MRTALVLFALIMAAPAQADGDFGSITARFGRSPVVHYRIAYDVYDNDGYCVKDEYGYYNDYACTYYDTKQTTVEVRIYRRKARSLRLVDSETVYGSHGLAKEDIYSYQLDAPYYAKRGTQLRYRVKFRLVDPVHDRIVDTMVRDFSITYS